MYRSSYKLGAKGLGFLEVSSPILAAGCFLPYHQLLLGKQSKILALDPCPKIHILSFNVSQRRPGLGNYTDK